MQYVFCLTRILPSLAIAIVLGLGTEATAQVNAEFSDEFDTQQAAPTPPSAASAPKPPAALAAPVQAAASVQASAPAPAPVQASAPAPAAVPVVEEVEPASAARAAQPEARDAQRLRVHNTWYGPTGGLHVVDAGSGPAGTFGLQLGVDFFSASNFLIAGDQNDYSGATLALRLSVTDYLEVFVSMASHANSNDRENPELLQVLGDTQLGIKAFHSVLPWLTLGGDLRLVVLNTVGSIGPVFNALSLGLRGNITADLRGLHDPVPLVLRGSLDYFFDNSANLVEDVEAARYARLHPNGEVDENEARHLLRRVERFALGINRTDAFGIALGLEAPLRAAEDFYVHPMMEWTLSLPINRQGYSCLLVAKNTGPGDPDGCLDAEGLASMPSTLTFGVRLLPPVSGLAFSLGVDVGVSGTSDFVRELAGNKPYDVLFALSYAVDARARPATEVRTVEVVKEVPKPSATKSRIDGVVVDAGTGAPVAAAVVRYVGRELSAQQADAQGKFVSYELEPGEVRLEFSHPEYDTRVCNVLLPVPVDARHAATSKLPAAPAINPYYRPATAPAVASSAGAKAVTVLVAMRCELTAKPRAGGVRGRVTDVQGQPVTGATVQLSGPSSETLTTDSLGQFVNPGLLVGSYNVRVDAPGYMIRLATFDVKPAEIATPELTLEPQPKQSQVELTKQEVRIRKEIFFMTNSAEISEKSNGLLGEVADVLLRNPQVRVVEIEGHTDNTGSPESNRQLSQNRAESVRTALIAGGVDAARLTAKGYGDTRPLVPNLTERNRARNRRVQFIIREHD
jgi:outer membrane protein OmpA-like peptidoglycan-associated protein